MYETAYNVGHCCLLYTSKVKFHDFVEISDSAVKYMIYMQTILDMNEL